MSGKYLLPNGKDLANVAVDKPNPPRNEPIGGANHILYTYTPESPNTDLSFSSVTSDLLYKACTTDASEGIPDFYYTSKADNKNYYFVKYGTPPYSYSSVTESVDWYDPNLKEIKLGFDIIEPQLEDSISTPINEYIILREDDGFYLYYKYSAQADWVKRKLPGANLGIVLVGGGGKGGDGKWYLFGDSCAGGGGGAGATIVATINLAAIPTIYYRADTCLLYTYNRIHIVVGEGGTSESGGYGNDTSCYYYEASSNNSSASLVAKGGSPGGGYADKIKDGKTDRYYSGGGSTVDPEYNPAISIDIFPIVRCFNDTYTLNGKGGYGTQSGSDRSKYSPNAYNESRTVSFPGFQVSRFLGGFKQEATYSDSDECAGKGGVNAASYLCAGTTDAYSGHGGDGGKNADGQNGHNGACFLFPF